MLKKTISKTDVICDWPSEFSSESEKEKIINLDELRAAIAKNDFSRVNQCMVIPQAKSVYGRNVSKGLFIPKPVKFEDDQWSNRFCRASVHVQTRSADFTKIVNKSMRLEAKVIATCWLWFISNKQTSKLGSIIRKIENLILIYVELENLGCMSFFDTNNAIVKNKLINRLSINRTKRSARNLYLSADSVILVNSLHLGEEYYSNAQFITTNSRADENDSNQHYCIPFRIFMEYWRYYINEIENEFSQINYQELTTLIVILKEFYERNRSHNWNMKKRSDKFQLYCRDEVQEKLQSLSSSDWPVMREFVKLTDYKRYSSPSPYYVVYVQTLERWLFQIGNLGSHCTQTMTGMRDSERKEILIGGLVKDGDSVGVVTKFHKFAPAAGKTDIYATTTFIASVFENIKKLYSTVLDIPEKKLDQIPMMGIHWNDYLRDAKLIPIAGTHHSRRREKHRSKAHIVINEDDLIEFRKLNPNIRTSEKVDSEIYIGAIWPFRTHDSRRSIAVHLKRLDLVSTNDLVRQFKHFACTQTEWYTSGFEHGGKQYQIAEDFCRDIDNAASELSASIAMSLQSQNTLIGEGGKQIIAQRNSDTSPNIYPSFKHAKSMAKRNKQHLRSLGNGFYCMNGQNCEMKPILSSASCNIKCPNMVADQDSLSVWRNRLTEYQKQLRKAENDQANDATLEFFKLEIQFYEEAIEMLGGSDH